jgi:hypothetical protein
MGVAFALLQQAKSFRVKLTTGALPLLMGLLELFDGR